jgi:myo-inositol-1(or 4)-monophosphatase
MLHFAMDLVREAGGILLNYLGRSMEIRSKSTEIDLVTEADLASERFMVSTIRKRYPGHRLLSEEEVQPDSDSEYLWLIDPLDGTINFAHGFPVFSVTVAVRHLADLIIGVTYDPLRDELFTVSRGHGAELNGQQIHVSTAGRLIQSLVATGFPYRKATISDNNLAEFNRVLPRIQGIRRGGSAALDLAYVAAGRLDGYWESHLSPWDWAAGMLMVQEAGGSVTSRDGRPWTFESQGMVATNGLIHHELMDVLNRA